MKWLFFICLHGCSVFDKVTEITKNILNEFREDQYAIIIYPDVFIRYNIIFEHNIIKLVYSEFKLVKEMFPIDETLLNETLLDEPFSDTYYTFDAFKDKSIALHKEFNAMMEKHYSKYDKISIVFTYPESQEKLIRIILDFIKKTFSKKKYKMINIRTQVGISKEQDSSAVFKLFGSLEGLINFEKNLKGVLKTDSVLQRFNINLFKSDILFDPFLTFQEKKIYTELHIPKRISTFFRLKDEDGARKLLFFNIPCLKFDAKEKENLKRILPEIDENDNDSKAFLEMALENDNFYNVLDVPKLQPFDFKEGKNLQDLKEKDSSKGDFVSIYCYINKEKNFCSITRNELDHVHQEINTKPTFLKNINIIYKLFEKTYENFYLFYKTFYDNVEGFELLLEILSELGLVFKDEISLIKESKNRDKYIKTIYSRINSYGCFLYGKKGYQSLIGIFYLLWLKNLSKNIDLNPVFKYLDKLKRKDEEKINENYTKYLSKLECLTFYFRVEKTSEVLKHRRDPRWAEIYNFLVTFTPFLKQKNLMEVQL
ncbi:hypothetical protein NGRA_0475 [Nosema granulosis]|uniref:Uncharacterized protein n=1 Tax=Nosema granulosis TaxID=83296 RepID=A0A9P6H0T0_9MICR|nr:hypothetical protein NGRA_0475 [Nosema granulosis]